MDHRLQSNALLRPFARLEDSMAQLLDLRDAAESERPAFDRYLLERQDQPLAVLLSDGRNFVMHAVAEAARGLDGRRFATVEAAERAIDRAIAGTAE
jgi:hypothetical protein